MPWLVIRDQQAAERFDEWNDAAERYTELVWEWARVNDEFRDVVGDRPENDLPGWVETLEGDDFGDGMLPGTTDRQGFETNDGIGGGALFRLMWEDPETGTRRHHFGPTLNVDGS